MAPFHLPEDESRLDFSLIRDGGITLYWRSEYLREDIEWFRQQKYQVFSFDCARWISSEQMHTDFQEILALPRWYGKNLDALYDCLCSEDVTVPDEGGTVFVLSRFDVYANSGGAARSSSGKSEAEVVLAILAKSTRYFLLTGKRFLTLVQSNNPHIRFEGIDCMAATWNQREFPAKSRGT